MSEPITVVVADHDMEYAKTLADALEQLSNRISVGAVVPSGTGAVERTVALVADALVCEFAMPDMDGFQIAKRVAADSPGTRVFWVTGAYSVDLVRRALASGVAGVFPKGDTLSASDLTKKIEEEVDAFRETLRQASAQGPLVTRGVGPFGLRVGRTTPERKELVGVGIRQRMIVVYSPKGGVGKTALASNLAVVLKLSPLFRGLSVALLDFDVGWGNLATVFDLYRNPARTPVHRNILHFKELDEARATRHDVEDMMLRARAGIDVLAAPPNPVLAREVDRALADKVLRMVRRYYDVVVCDGGPKLPEAVDAAMEQATDILVVTLPEVQAVTNIIQLRELLLDGGNDETFLPTWKKMALVVNRVGGKLDLDLKEIQQTTRMRIAGTLPDDPWVAGSLKEYTGKVLVEAKPEAPFAAAMRRLAQDLVGAYPGAEKQAAGGARRGLFRLLKPKAGAGTP